MDVILISFISVFIYKSVTAVCFPYKIKDKSLEEKQSLVPPEACFKEFNWDDCGKPPTPVLYYWKPGSRCEVALWRGCLPNMNMFDNEYECVSTCIFTARARAEDFHQNNEIDYDLDIVTEPNVLIRSTEGKSNVSSNIDRETTTEKVDVVDNGYSTADDNTNGATDGGTSEVVATTVSG